jgi:RNA polymerase sigma-70 factor (ECF subfamily)
MADAMPGASAGLQDTAGLAHPPIFSARLNVAPHSCDSNGDERKRMPNAATHILEPIACTMAEDRQRSRERLTVLRAQTGDRAAFDELVDTHQERLMYYVHRLVGDAHHARDVLQEIWLDVFRTLGKLQSPDAFRVWMYRIAHNRAVSHLRRRKLDSEAHERLAEAACEGDVSELELLENAELVHAALARLSVVHREVMTLRFLEDMNVAEIARVMDCSEGTAKSRLHYAKNALRRILDEEAGHD